MALQGPNNRNFQRSPKNVLTIPSGQLTHGTVLDLKKSYAFLVIAIVSANGIPAGAELSIEAGIEAANEMFSFYEATTPPQPWVRELPSSGNLIMRVEGVDFMRFLRLSLSANATQDVVIHVWGMDGGS